MATITITEFAEQAKDIANRLIPVGIFPAIATQDVTGTTTSTQSSAFNTKTRFIRVIADSNAVIEIGSNPTAVSTPAGSRTTRLAADSAEYFGVSAGDKIAVKDA